MRHFEKMLGLLLGTRFIRGVFGWDDLIYLAASAAVNYGANQLQKPKGGSGQDVLSEPLDFGQLVQPKTAGTPPLQPQQFNQPDFSSLIDRNRRMY